MKPHHLTAVGTGWLLLATSWVYGIPKPVIYSNFDAGSAAPGEIVGQLDSVEGQIGDAFDFTRDDANHVNYGDVANPGRGSFTYSIWINPHQTSGGAFFPIGKGNRSSGTVGWSIFLENDRVIPRANYEGGGGNLRLGLNHPITADEGWVHIAVVIDNESGAFVAYYNGKTSGGDGNASGWSRGGGGGQTNTFEPGQSFNPSEDLLVGRRSTNGASFDGAIDEVAIWDQALPEEDIIQIFERGLNGQGIPSSNRILGQSIPAKSVGNVATGASFGMDFQVRAPVLLTDLGAFDSISDGFFQSPTVQLWTRDDAGTPDDFSDDTGIEIVATASFSNEEPGTLEGGARFKALAQPLILQPGDYTVAAFGWGSGEEMSDGRQRGDAAVGELPDAFQLGFVGSGRFGSGGQFPDMVPDGGPPNLFGAGNFIVRLLAKDEDGDGLEDGWEIFHFGHLDQGPGGDFDQDGSTNAREFAAETKPNQADTDGDGLNDGAEADLGSHPLVTDTDGDRLTDGAEVNVHGTDPTSTDSDGDHFADGAEIALDTDPIKAESSPEENSVFDGQVDEVALWQRTLTGEEITALHRAGLAGRSALASDPNVADGDGMPDGYESANGLDPDEDDLADGEEITRGTNPRVADSDDDGLTDGAEVHEHQTDPLLADSDGDGLADGAEIHHHRTTPSSSDSDGDGFPDPIEIESSSNPGDAASIPAADLHRGLFAYYTFVSVVGDSVPDAVAARNGTKMNGGPDTSVAGLFGQGAHFAGGRSREDHPCLDLGVHVEKLSRLTTGTISAWIKADTEDLVTDVLTIMAVSDTAEGSMGMRFWVSNGGAFGTGTLAYGLRGGPASGDVVARDVNLLDGKWHHVAVGVGPGQTAHLYVDGILQGTETISFLHIPKANAAALGRNEASGGSQWFYAGQLDDVTIWDRSLTSAEVFLLHHQGLEGKALQPLQPTGAAPPEGDTDGVDDAVELIAGTDANDSGDYLRVSRTAIATAGILIEWASKPFKGYRVEYSADLTEWEIVSDDLRGQMKISHFIDTDPGRRTNASGYYRVTTNHGIIQD